MASDAQLAAEFHRYKDKGVTPEQMRAIMRAEIERLVKDDPDQLEQTYARWLGVIDSVWGTP